MRHAPLTSPASLPPLVEQVEFLRLDACRKLEPERRSELGQFFTPSRLALFMASMFEATTSSVRLLDAGAGVGSLSSAFVVESCGWKEPPKEISVTAYEVDSSLVSYLRATLDGCRAECERVGVSFLGEVREEDFIKAGVALLKGGLFATPHRKFNRAILNPPYHKLHSQSEHRRLLSSIGVETSNLYTAFLSLAIQLLEPGGELVAITPRSFCNGSYFKSFRKFLLSSLSLRKIHVFESRTRAFQDDEVLQENIIFHAVKGAPTPERVVISSSEGPEDELISSREIEYRQLVLPNDPDLFLRIVPDELGDQVAQRMRTLTKTLSDLGLSVSTGRVVDFRARDFLRKEPGHNTVPLIYPCHLEKGFVSWPNPNSKKPNALENNSETKPLLLPTGTYVLVKRFSSKEERRRLVAALYDPTRLTDSHVGFENHLNVFHKNGGGLPLQLAKGLAAFLNSSLVDAYFRQFNGHTQVNATDLRNLKYPTLAELEALGNWRGETFPEQNELDRRLKKELGHVSEEKSYDPIEASKKIEEAREALKALGMPSEQHNERSAMTLLSLLDLKPETPWSKAGKPLMGITPMMEFFKKHYGKEYAPNTRETVRRRTVHQFVDAGLILLNPDKPERPVNSPYAVYQIAPVALELLRTYGTKEWDKRLPSYLASIETLKKRYAREREMSRIPVTVAPGKTITLSPGGQNVLIKEILDQFCPHFTPGGRVLYVGDAKEKWAYSDNDALKALGVLVGKHGKMPDVVVHHVSKNWLVLVEAVTSHGPVDPKRRGELASLFKDSKAGLVYVTAFLTKKSMTKYLMEISWETEVWVAECPSHMIHFDGERFLGPYEEPPKE